MTDLTISKQKDAIVSLIETLKLDQERSSVKLNQLQDEISILRQETNAVRKTLESLFEKTGESGLN
jgi:Mg2+ and Co2+ transporter CorA